MSSGSKPEVWPLWLEGDIQSLAIWSVEYDAAPTRWRGHSMARADRAENVLSLLLAEQRLQRGDLAFVVHSFGGLIFKQIVRFAHDRAPSDPNVDSFLQRISRVTFLGTPHQGAGLASVGKWFRWMTRPSDAAEGLDRNDPDLRELNAFYRRFALEHAIDTQNLLESRRTNWLGQIVKPESADPGLPSAPILVDANHYELAAPSSKASEVYILIKNQLLKPARAEKLTIADPSTMEVVNTPSTEGAKVLGQLEKLLSSASSAPKTVFQFPASLVDAEAERRVKHLRQIRFFIGANHLEEATQLAHALVDGELAFASQTIKRKALAWCARVLLAKPDRSEALILLDQSLKLGRTEISSITEALAKSYAGETSASLGLLASIDSDEARAASFISIVLARKTKDPLAWLDTAGLSASNVSSDGKYFILNKYFEASKWDEALAVSRELHADDFMHTPVLWYMAALANMIQAVPAELRPIALSSMPIDFAELPLADDDAGLGHRRAASALFAKAAHAASALGCPQAANDAADHALWLNLQDPQLRSEALGELAKSMRDPLHSLRRLCFAFRARLKLDYAAVDQEIERQFILSDGNSIDAAMARFTLALNQKSPRETVEYIDRHRGEFTKHIRLGFVSLVEIHALIQSGDIDRAEQLANSIPAEAITEIERFQFLGLVAEARSATPIEARISRYVISKSLGDLVNLVGHLEKAQDWPRLSLYARDWFDRTHSLDACRILAQAQYTQGEYKQVLGLFEQYPTLLSQSDLLESLRAWSLYQTGDIKAARTSLALLRSKRDEENDRSLLVNLAITSGDWLSLGGFAEMEWERRSDRTAKDLLRAAQVAAQVGANRLKDLLNEASSKAGDDAAILLGCYSTAVKAGWENEETSKWLQRAIELSDADGPVKRVTLKELLDEQPKWRKREADIWDQVRGGSLPMFAAGQLVHRSLGDLVLMRAIANMETTDLRKRSPVYAYSGARNTAKVTAKTAAFDPTALLTIAISGAIKPVLQFFDRIFLPHSTLNWLLEESERIRFHQPTKFVEAHEIKRLVETGALRKFERTARVDDELVMEVGKDLASLFAEATSEGGDTSRQQLVVRSSPVHRAGSLMEEEANLGKYADRVCSCSTVVAALRSAGQLTSSEEQRALSFLQLKEQPWPSSLEIKPGAVLYLDDLSVTYLQHLHLLEKLHRAGFVGVVPPAEIMQGEGFIQYEDLSARAQAVIEDLRAALAEGITGGTVRLAASSIDESIAVDGIQRHPTFQLLDTARLAEATVVDDRHYNQHMQITADYGIREVFSTYDVICSAVEDDAQRAEILTRIRLSGFCFVPIDRDELISLIDQAPIENGILIESAELKSISEALLTVRLSTSLQLPNEEAWITGLLLAGAEAVRAQWTDDSNEEISRAKSTWILERFDVRHWYANLPVNQANILRIRYRAQILSLAMLNTEVGTSTRQRYWAWFEEVVLKPIRKTDRKLFEQLIEQAEQLITGAIEHGPEGTDHD